VWAIRVSGSTIYVGEPLPRSTTRHAAYCPLPGNLGWRGLSPAATFLDGALNNEVDVVAVSGTDVYVGGIFTNIANGSSIMPEADYIVKWDGASWSALGSDGAGDGALNDGVYALAVNGADLYVGGYFDNVNNNGTILASADRIARWDGTNWHALSGDGSGNGSLNGEVDALGIDGDGNLYVGGTFYDVNNAGNILASADYIAVWDGSNWAALGSNGAGDGSLNNAVNALVVSGTDLYVGGEFDNVNNGGTVLGAGDYVVKWDGSNWSALGNNAGGDGSLNGSVYALAISGTDLYVGGYFYNVNNSGTVLGAADYIAKWDGSNWSALGSNGGGDGSRNSDVYAFAVSGTNLYVGGWFMDVNDNGTVLDAADYISRWDGTNWSALGSDGLGGGALNNGVYSLAISGSTLYTGGYFDDVNNNGTVLPAADYLAAYGIGVPDTIPPAVTAITRASPNLTRAASVDFAVTFSEAVTGVDVSDFTLALTGNITGATVSGVAGSGTTYIVTVSTGSGSGTLRLDVSDDDSILDAAANPLGGTGVGNGDFTSGEAYVVRLYAVYLPVTLR
jgi:membrane protein implicated in regulation of membrane protease activity